MFVDSGRHHGITFFYFTYFVMHKSIAYNICSQILAKMFVVGVV